MKSDFKEAAAEPEAPQPAARTIQSAPGDTASARPVSEPSRTTAKS